MDSKDLSWRERAEIISEALEPLSRKWHSKLISFLLRKDSASFTQLRESMEGISNKVLSDSLSDLQEHGLIQKTGDQDPKYSLTDKGKDLSSVLNELADWGESYLREDKIEILIVEDNEDQAEMYKRWLEPKYSAEIATNFDQALRKYDKEKDVVLLDRKLHDSEAEELIDSIEGIENKHIVIITGMEPDLALLDMPVQDYLIKPINRDKLRNTIKKFVEVDRGTEKVKELLELLSKKQVLDEKPSKVRKKEEYQKLVERIDELKEEVENIPESLDERS